MKMTNKCSHSEKVPLRRFDYMIMIKDADNDDNDDNDKDNRIDGNDSKDGDDEGLQLINQ